MKMLKIEWFTFKLYGLIVLLLYAQPVFSENITKLSLTANVGETVAFSKDYETVAFLHSIVDPDKSISVVLKGHFLNGSGWAANGGILLRRYLHQQVIGINFFYDTLTAQKLYRQVGIGAELLGKSHSIRTNIYLPIGRKSQCTQFDEFCYPGGYRVFYREKKNALSGGDIEYVKKLTFFGYHHEIGFGGYGYLPNRTKSRVGGTVRITSILGSSWTFQALGSYDSRCKAMIQGSLTFSIPFSKNQESDSRYYQQLRRQDIIVRGFYYYPWCKNY